MGGAVIMANHWPPESTALICMQLKSTQKNGEVKSGGGRAW